MVFNASTHVHKAGWAGFPQLQKYFSPSVLPIWDSDGINREKKKKKKSLNILHFYSVY